MSNHWEDENTKRPRRSERDYYKKYKNKVYDYLDEDLYDEDDGLYSTYDGEYFQYEEE